MSGVETVRLFYGFTENEFSQVKRQPVVCGVKKQPWPGPPQVTPASDSGGKENVRFSHLRRTQQ